MASYHFKTYSYTVENLVDKDYLSWAIKYFDLKFNVIKDYSSRRTDMQEQEVVEPFSRCYYNDALAQTLLLSLTPKMEKIVGKSLYPTYSFCRYYEEGQRLIKHVDRPACEYSITLPINANSWPIHFENSDGEIFGIKLNPGQGLVYKGQKLPHFRHELKEGKLIQLHLHYVDKNGPNAEWKFDKKSIWEDYSQSASFFAMSDRSEHISLS